MLYGVCFVTVIGCDLSTMTQETLDILTAPEVIAVNQDKLGTQGHIVNMTIINRFLIIII